MGKQFDMRRRVLLGSIMTFALAGRAAAQEKYPSRPVRLVVPNPAGGSAWRRNWVGR
jgi:tripartite-type tricarboxylate transporter receptor subunit TctC